MQHEVGNGLLWRAMMPLIALLVGSVIGYFGRYYFFERLVGHARQQAKEIKHSAEMAAQQILVQAKDKALELRSEAEKEAKHVRAELDRREQRLQDRQDRVDNRREALEELEKRLNQRQSSLDRRLNQVNKLEEEQRKKLEVIAQMSQVEARQELLHRVEETTRDDTAMLIRELEAEAIEEADKRARKVIALAVERLASEHVSEITVSLVPLPNDDMKGRIIGRQGRNIRALEAATGVDLVVDDTPEAVTISSFDPVRREVARRALSKLVIDGRIHPARIEKEVSRAKQEVDLAIKEAGENALIELGISGLPAGLIKLIGRLKFRTSYGQNQYHHAIETAKIATILAAELHADVEVAKLGGLLHDIGKAVSHEVEGPHALIGADIARRYGISEKVVNCIASHHHEEEQKCIEAVLVAAADAISGARPGARREAVDDYIHRVNALQEIARAFPGVSDAYAIQAGREIRVIVKPEDVDDLGAMELSRQVARKIEDNLQYPGLIKVTVVRETRAVEMAK